MSEAIANMRIANRARDFGTSIFTHVSQWAARCGAVNLGQGFPDFPAPAFVKQAACDAINSEQNQYAPSPGVPRLRQAVAAHWRARHGIAWDADDEITVCQGATEALFAATLGLLNPGDEAIVFEPFYDAYVPDIRMAGGVPRFVRLHPPHWSFRDEELVAAFSPRTKLVFVNTPHNPTGKVFTAHELDAIAHFCVQHDVVAVADEVYSELTFDGVPHVPLASRAGMRERTITVDSLGKTFSVTGWKVGWALAAAPLTQAVRATHQFITFCNPTPLQAAAAVAIEQAPALGYYTELRMAYEHRRQRLTQILEQAKLPPLPIRGAYFLLADWAQRGFSDELTFCRHLIEHVGVAGIPISSFYADPSSAPPLMRFCFAKSDGILEQAGERLQRL